MKRTTNAFFMILGGVVGAYVVLIFSGCCTIEGLGHDLAASARATREFISPKKPPRAKASQPVGGNEDLPPLSWEQDDEEQPKKPLTLINPGQSGQSPQQAPR